MWVLNSITTFEGIKDWGCEAWTEFEGTCNWGCEEASIVSIEAWDSLIGKGSIEETEIMLIGVTVSIFLKGIRVSWFVELIVWSGILKS